VLYVNGIVMQDYNALSNNFSAIARTRKLKACFGCQLNGN